MNCTYVCHNDAEMPTLKIQNPEDCQFTLLTLKVVQSRAPPIQPQKCFKYQKPTPKKGQKLTKKCLKILFYVLSFVFA